MMIWIEGNLWDGGEDEVMSDKYPASSLHDVNDIMASESRYSFELFIY